MSNIKYELSLWRDFPGAYGIQEEKICIIAATGMDNAGRAQNIELKKEYNGRETLTFEIPVKYNDIFTGAIVSNPLVDQVLDHSKLKLWRDELWWNPFKTNLGLDEQNGCTKFEGGFEQGRWYEFIVVNRSQKRSKKKMVYSYTCDSLFMNELSRTGYNLEFVPDTDIMSANGMGTAHELAERIVDGTDWKYIKTEVFPDYKEEFNAVTGETVKVPVSTDQIEFVKGLDRYVYCYRVKIDDNGNAPVEGRVQELEEEIVNLGNKEGVTLVAGKDFGFIPNESEDEWTFWWKPQDFELEKDYIYNYTKTNIITNYADRVLCYTNGLIHKGEDTKALVDEATLLSSTNLWEPLNGATVDAICDDSLSTEDKTYYYINLGNTTSEKPLIYNSGYSDKPLEKGEHLVINLTTETTGTSPEVIIYIYDGQPNETGSNWIQREKFYANDEDYNCFNYSYILTLNQRVGNPYFAFGYKDSVEPPKRVDGLFIYKFIGATEEIDRAVKEWIATQEGYCYSIKKIVEKMPTIDKVTNIDLTNNTCTIEGLLSPFWVPVGSMTQNNFKDGLEVYCIEFERNGEYFDIYPSFTPEELTKISSFDTDKRRAISGNKSNRFSLLETVSKTFFCFTRFMVEHDNQGYVVKDSSGKPKKYFTYVSELGRRNFNGFTYGVNLEEVERKIDSKSLVTKVYVDSIDNQYRNNGLVTIQDSVYNKMGENFFYNFSYFKRQGFFDASQFMADYKHVYDYVGLRNAQAKKANEEYINKEQYRQSKQTAYDTHLVQVKAIYKLANDELNYIKWKMFTEGDRNLAEYLRFDSAEELEKFKFPTIDFKTIAQAMIDNGVCKAKTTPFETIGYYMDSINMNGLGPEANINTLRAVDVYQTQYNNLVATIDTEKQELEKTDGINDQVKKLLEKFNSLLKEKNKKLEWFEKKYHRFILEGTWSGNDYIEPDTYYLDATRAMATSCMPKVSYSMNVLDLSKVCNPYNPEDTDWGKDFTYDVGDTTYIKDEELFGSLEQKSMISSIDIHVDENKPDDITLTNFETRFEELFQSIAAAVTTIQLNENIYSRAENFTPEGAIDISILQKSFNTNKNLVIASANNLVSQDNRGITIKTDDDSGQLLRAIAGGIFLSNDNGQTYTAGLTADGFNASLITAGQIDTSKIVIRSSEIPQYVLDNLGLTAYSRENKSIGSTSYQHRDSSITRFDQFGIYMTDNGNMFTANWWKSADALGSLITPAFQTVRSPISTVDISSLEDTIFYINVSDVNYRFKKFEIYATDSNEIENEVLIYDSENGQWEQYMNNVNFESVSYYDGKITFNYKPTISNEYFGVIYLNSCACYFSSNWKEIVRNNRPDVFHSNFPYIKNFLIKFYYEPQYLGHEDYIERNSIFSLTRKGLNINSGKQSNETHMGSVQISTKIPQINVYSYNNTEKKTYQRVKLGHIKQDNDGKQIHGLDIYDGAITIYSKAYEAGIAPNENDRLLWTERVKDENNEDTDKVALKLQGHLQVGQWKINDAMFYHAQQRGDDYYCVAFFPSNVGTIGRVFGIGKWDPDSAINGSGGWGNEVAFQIYGDGTTVIKNGKLEVKNSDNSIAFKCGGKSESEYYDRTFELQDMSYQRGYAAITTGTYMLGLGDPEKGLVINSAFVPPLEETKGYTQIGIRSQGFGVSASTVDTTITPVVVYGYSTQGSDIRFKKDIAFLDNKYDVFFDELNSVSFKYNNGDPATHYGFIAQSVLSSLNKISISKQNQGFVNELDGYYYITYTEFIALNTWQIQKAKARIASLETEMAELKSRLDLLTNS